MIHLPAVSIYGPVWTPGQITAKLCAVLSLHNESYSLLTINIQLGFMAASVTKDCNEKSEKESDAEKKSEVWTRQCQMTEGALVLVYELDCNSSYRHGNTTRASVSPIRNCPIQSMCLLECSYFKRYI